jgi:hypothetical protein
MMTFAVVLIPCKGALPGCHTWQVTGCGLLAVGSINLGYQISLAKGNWVL